jgi:hypothetical protein
MSTALEAGLSVTALHNHFFFDEPKVFFMHIGGEGTAENLGRAVKAALAKVKEIRAQSAIPSRTFAGGFTSQSNAIDAAPLESIFGAKATSKDGMAKFVFGRDAKMPCGCEVGKEMGINTWAAFAGTNDHAVVDGDFCVLSSELQPVLKTLRSHGINIVAIHQHMAIEEPRYIFFHYWATGSAKQLATSVKKAVDLLKL